MGLKQKHKLFGQQNSNDSNHAGLSRRALLAATSSIAASLALSPVASAQVLKSVPTQYIAALGDPEAVSGNNAQDWGLWRNDPGPRGVDLDDYDKLVSNGGVAPAQWTFDNQDWWLEEHGLIMEAPEFPLPAGLYLVTGDRTAQAVLTVHPKASDGTQSWELGGNTSIYDVTHLRCRSGRYTPNSANSCSPEQAQKVDFPVMPGADMPGVDGCNKLDYAVFIVRAIADFPA